ncbi:MAG: hypothetical protein K2M78_00480 [Lachnospiraceae bacterium]|nr:hypothetical protein [Lachnospiraceae bacterium]
MESGEQRAASNLLPEDKLLRKESSKEDGKVVYVESVLIERLTETVKVYNLEVEGLHTYFVASGVLVHNMCDEYDKYDEYLDDESPTTERIGKQNGKTPRNNQRQNKQVRDITKGVDKDKKREFHNWISHMGFNYDDLEDEWKDFT